YTATATTRINLLTVGFGAAETPDVPSGFYTGLVNNADDWTLDEGVVPEGLNYVWSWDSKYGLKASAYYNNEPYETDIWAVSPVIDLTGAESADLKFSQAANHLNGNFDQISTAVRVENGEWQTIEVAPLPSGSDWNFVDSSVSLADFVGKKIQIGFNYKSTTENASTWEIKNLTVDGNRATIISGIEEENGVAEYYTIQGVKVANPDNGLYIRVKNGKATKILVK
ncbi:MAG: immune inhibitor A, partial [Muribaculaceae bacterium]|nr:immune inhibitor A [Muribaculaceae bacterium]